MEHGVRNVQKGFGSAVRCGVRKLHLLSTLAVVPQITGWDPGNTDSTHIQLVSKQLRIPRYTDRMGERCNGDRRVVVWAHASRTYRSVLERAARAFPEVRLEVHSIRDLKKPYLNGLVEELQAPTTPLAVFPISARDMAPLVRRRWLKPLDTFATAHGRTRLFASEAMQLVTAEGSIIGMPDDLAPYAWMVRLDRIPNRHLSPPRTWQAFERQLVAWKKAGRAAPIKVQAGGPTQRYGFLLALLGSNGCSFARGLENMMRDREALVEAYEWMRHAVEEGLLTYPASIYEEETSTFDLFQDGDFCSIMAFPAGLKAWPVELQRKVRLFPFPLGPRGIGPCTPFNGSVWCVPHNTASLDVAFALLAALTDPATVRELELEGGMPFPAMPNLWKDAAVLRRKPIYRDASRVTPSAASYSADFLDVDLQKLEETFRQSLQRGDSGEAWLKQLTSESHRLALRTVAHQIVRKATLYIDDHLGTIEGVGEVARAVNRHADYVNRLFQKELKSSCRAYISTRRLERARHMLGDVTLSIKEIAHQLGFASTSSFGRAFQKHWGCSAQVMRKKEIKRIRSGEDPFPPTE